MRIPYTVRFEEKHLEALKLYAKSHGFKRAALMRKALVDLLIKRGVNYAIFADPEIPRHNPGPKKYKP